MSYTKTECTLVVCDNCGKKLGEGDDYVVHFDEKLDALDVYLEDHGWSEDGNGKHACSYCPILLTDEEMADA